MVLPINIILISKKKNNMKTINKISVIVFTVVALMFVSCTDDAVRDPSPEANPNSNRVYFPEQDSSKLSRTLLLGIEETSFEVRVARAKYAEPLTVKLKLTEGAEYFSIPESVSFDAGDSITSFEVTVGEIELLKSYSVSIIIDDAVNADPYYKYSETAYSVKKEDFAPYAEGIYDDPWFWEDSWEQTLEYSPATDLYRFKGLFDEGGDDVLFEWDRENTINIKGKATNVAAYLQVFNTGYYSSANGSYIYAFYLNDQERTGGGEYLSYDDATKTFTFPIFWGIASGAGWGWDVSTYEITTVF
jgi:hypothetical protein